MIIIKNLKDKMTTIVVVGVTIRNKYDVAVRSFLPHLSKRLGS